MLRKRVRVCTTPEVVMFSVTVGDYSRQCGQGLRMMTVELFEL